MFSSKKALSAFSLGGKTLPLAIVAVAAGILGLAWLGADAAEARGRSVTLTRNELTLPAAATGGGNAPCLQSLVEWEPLGSRVEVQFFLQRRSGANGVWSLVASDTQPLPGKAASASVDWGIGAPGLQYRHWVQIFSVKGKDGASRNHQLVSEFSSAVPVFGSCGG